MEQRLWFKEDEHDVEFSDTTNFAFQRMNDAISVAQQMLSNADREKVMEPRTWGSIYTDLQRRAADAKALSSTRRLLNHLQPLPVSLGTLVNIFIESIVPHKVDFNLLWGLLDLNTKLSLPSTDKLQRTVAWSKKLRNVVEVFNRCLDACEDKNEARYKMVDVFECMLQIYSESIKHLRLCPTDTEAARGWRSLESTINENLSEIEAAVKHLNDITRYTAANLERQTKNLNLRNAPAAIPEEYATFPIRMIPRTQNDQFYGREDELEKMNRFLDYRENDILRTYTIYGRRGVGKTDIALQYAYTNPSNFDAIFWVACETSVSIRQSFSEIAVELCLPGADRNGHHEENQLAVLKWLKITRRRWLLVFDNAEKEYILRGYWPIGASGSILITSRKYYNFMNDAKRQGDTVKPFNERQSWNLLLQFLGQEWVDKERNGQISGTEELAGRNFMRSLGGLALAILQAAELIRNPSIGDRTINSTYKSFKEHSEALPERPGMQRGDIVKSLDTVWSMTFNHLKGNARALLGILSLLSPDGILIDLFLPKNQKALDGKLRFCKQRPEDLEPTTDAALASVITAPAPLIDAINELVEWKLVVQEGRDLWAHRVVQEAMNYHSAEDLQECFHSTSAIVYEAFPKQLHGDYLSSQWAACQSYISHGVQLSRQFMHYRAGGKDILKGSKAFINLLANCAWYLYEVSDYDMCLRLTETAKSAFEDDETGSQEYATICNIAGCAYYELNKLLDCRNMWELCLKLYDSALKDELLERAAAYNNMGNLEHASDNLVDAESYHNAAIELRLQGGDAAANMLALSYLCLSRVHFSHKDYDTAFKVLGKSEALFVRTAGAAAPFMAHVHYAYGNMEYAQDRWRQAKRSYETGLKIALATTTIHPITISLYYSLGCVENEVGNLERAKMYLDKAMSIAQLRSPNRDDGTMARIMWKTSKVLENDTFGSFQEDADQLRIRAELARTMLNNSGEGALVLPLDDDGNTDAAEEEDSYDALVPGFFR